ncbi:hypothetical protein NDU88_004636 [Pleurodeles waltl]|uniref:Uncharacterized protein n=1 Tax=Pleurodeles waltl TaxID=8319 RepID=A0AAV7LIV3_PLEWA|nr:hypothetical protein NDU88_004636 [Pleurodeles waltl]
MPSNLEYWFSSRPSYLPESREPDPHNTIRRPQLHCPWSPSTAPTTGSASTRRSASTGRAAPNPCRGRQSPQRQQGQKSRGDAVRNDCRSGPRLVPQAAENYLAGQSSRHRRPLSSWSDKYLHPAEKSPSQVSGHLVSMPDIHLPKRLFYGELTEGECTQGGKKKHFKDTLKVFLKSFGFDPDSWETLAQDRPTWRSCISTGATSHKQSRTAEVQKKCDLRKSMGNSLLKFSKPFRT